MNVPEIHREIAHAWVDGAEVEQWCEHTQSWLSGSLWPRFSASKYRLKPIPHSIDWSHVNERYIVLVAHKTGEVRLVTKAPTRGPGENWYSVPGPGESIDAENFTSFKRGTVSWDESLVFRPSKEMCAEPVKVDRIGLTAEQWAQIPSEYNWIAKDQDGYWYAYESEPESDPKIDYGAWKDNQNPNSHFPITVRLPGLLPNLQGSELWEDCLIKRPHPPAELYPEGFSWDRLSPRMKFIAKDLSEAWYAYRSEPQIMGNSWNAHGEVQRLYHPPHPDIRWESSMRRRP